MVICPFFTVIVPVYVAAAAFAGTFIEIGLAGKAASVTGKNPFAVAITSQVMLYVVGETVVAL